MSNAGPVIAFGFLGAVIFGFVRMYWKKPPKDDAGKAKDITYEVAGSADAAQFTHHPTHHP